MEIMKKNLRSVELRSNGRYSYLRIDVEEAKELVETKEWIYISKEEYKRRSKHYSFTPCQGTLVNKLDEDGDILVNENGDNVQEISKDINWDKFFQKQRKAPNSTKLGRGSINLPQVYRKNKFNGNFCKKDWKKAGRK